MAAQTPEHRRYFLRSVPKLFLLIALFACRGTAFAQAQASNAPLQIADFGDLKLANGGVIHNFHLAYRTLGTLNADRSNAVLWPTWLGGRSEDLLLYTGPGNVVDTSKYFVILVDSIGNGLSSSPSNSKTQPFMKFPEFSIRDMVESEYRLVTEKLGLVHLHAVVGVSMGGMQSFAWAVMHADFLDAAAPIMGSPQSTSYDKLLWNSQIDALEADPAWNHGNPTGPLTKGAAISAEIGSMNATSPAYRVEQTDAAAFEPFMTELRGTRMDAGSAWNQIRQRQAIISLDLPKELGISLETAANRVRAKMMVMISPEDHMVNPAPAIRFAKAIDAPVIELDSPCGHLSNACISIGPILAQFLADPSSVRSQTLHDMQKQ